MHSTEALFSRDVAKVEIDFNFEFNNPVSKLEVNFRTGYKFLSKSASNTIRVFYMAIKPFFLATVATAARNVTVYDSSNNVADFSKVDPTHVSLLGVVSTTAQ